MPNALDAPIVSIALGVGIGPPAALVNFSTATGISFCLTIFPNSA